MEGKGVVGWERKWFCDSYLNGAAPEESNKTNLQPARDLRTAAFQEKLI